ncbi:MAG: hypothetical protein AB1757_09065 [Acidobacteriota bacterium]
MQKPETKDVFNYLITPLLFLTVALAGGMRIAVEGNELRFLAPQLITLILAAFAMVLFIRGGLVNLRERVGERLGLTENLSGGIFLLSLYFATAQVFNLVTPERGLLNFCFNLFYFLIFFNNLFVVFNPPRLVKSLAVVLGASFLLKYLLLADWFAPSDSLGKAILQKLMQTASLGALDFETFASATGYLAFAALMLYIIGLYLIAPPVDQAEELLYRIFIERHKLSPGERRRLLQAVTEATDEDDEIIEAEVISERPAKPQNITSDR